MVEGNDDERFFNAVIQPMLQERYSFITTYKYASVKKKKVSNFIRSIRDMQADYIFLADINNSPCVTNKKEKLQGKYENIDTNKIVIVIKEIESWYLAGLGKEACRRLGLSPVRTTENMTKEQFNARIPTRFTSRIDFMIEILSAFSAEEAKRKNHSFAYFMRKHVGDAP